MLQRSSKQVRRFAESASLLCLLVSCSKRTHCSANQVLSAVMALATLSLFPIEASAQRENTPRAGGNGGTSFSLECPQNMILGLRGRAGNFIDQVRGVCSKYDAAGQRIGSTALTNPASAGGTGGGEWEMMCGGQTALTSIGGRAGLVVDQLFRACKTVAPSGLATAPAFADGIKVGGNSSAPVFNLPCPNDKFADRIVGRAGNLVDQIGLSCIPAPLAATRIKQLTLGTPANQLSTGERVRDIKVRGCWGIRIVAEFWAYIYAQIRGGPMPTTLASCEAERAQLLQQFQSLGDLRPGSITAMARRCGKPTCHCAQAEDPGHGPQFRLTRKVGGKTVTETFSSPAALRKAQGEIAEFHRLQQLSAALVAVNEDICRLRPIGEEEGGWTAQEKKRLLRSIRK